MNLNDTHGLFIQLPNGNAFIDGLPDKCEHEWNGDTIFFTASGKRITPYTYLNWTKYTEKVRNDLIQDYHRKIEDEIVGGTSSCSKCGKEFHPEMF